jgi:hypothetical protein
MHYPVTLIKKYQEVSRLILIYLRPFRNADLKFPDDIDGPFFFTNV